MVQSEQSRKQVPFSVNLRPGEFTIGLYKPFRKWQMHGFPRVLTYTAACLVNTVDILQSLRAFAVYDY